MKVNIAKLFITDELLLLRDWYISEKEVLKEKINESKADLYVNRKLLSKLSLYNTRIIVIKESITELKNTIKKTGLLKLNDWQLN